MFAEHRARPLPPRSPRPSRRVLLHAAVGLMGLAAFAACSPPAAPTATTAPKPTTAPAAAPTTAPAAPATAAPAAAPTTAPAAPATAAPAAQPTVAATGIPLSKGTTGTIAEKHTNAAPAGAVRKQGGEFRWGNGPLARAPLGIGAASGNTNQLMYSQLWDISSFNDKVLPDLAESWTLADGGKRLDIKLRKGVKWHDGTPFTAKDVELSFRVAVHPKAASPAGQRFGITASVSGARDFNAGKADGIAGVKIVDDHTMSLQFDQPWAAHMFQLSRLAIIPNHLWGKVAYEDINKSLNWGDKPVGTGPFKFSKFVDKQFTEFVAYDDYYAGRPYLDKVISVAYDSPDTAALAMEKGEIDFLYHPTGDALTRLRKVAGLVELVSAGMFAQAMKINTEHPTMKDKRVRQALLYAIDRQAIVDGILPGRATVAHSLFPASVPQWTHAGLKKFTYDPNMAKQLLKDAGWNASTNVELIQYYGDKETTDLMGAVQQYWEAVGVKTTTRFVTSATVNEVMARPEFQVAYVGPAAAAEPDDILALYSPAEPACKDAAINSTRHCIPKLVELYDKERAVADPVERKKFIDQWQEVFIDELPLMPLWEPYRFSFIKKQYCDWNFAMLGGNLNIYYAWEKAFVCA